MITRERRNDAAAEKDCQKIKLIGTNNFWSAGAFDLVVVPDQSGRQSSVQLGSTH
jgi:hypothetical protein